MNLSINGTVCVARLLADYIAKLIAHEMKWEGPTFNRVIYDTPTSKVYGYLTMIEGWGSSEVRIAVWKKGNKWSDGDVHVVALPIETHLGYARFAITWDKDEVKIDLS